MTTALDIITRSFQRIGVYAPGEVISAADSSDALDLLNEMIDQWSLEDLMCYANTETSIPLIVAQAQYTLTGSARPISINYAAGAAYVLDSNLNNWPVTVRTQNEWNLISLNRQVTGNIPTDMFYDPQFPTGILNVYPVPNVAGYTLFFDSTIQLASFATLTTAVTLPPGYVSALRNNLAVMLHPDFLSGEPSASLVTRANNTKAWIKRKNTKAGVIQFDPEIVSRSQYTYNIYRNSPT